MTTPGNRRFTLHIEGHSDRCSLCDKRRETVGELFDVPEGPGSTIRFICDGCVQRCAYVLEHRRTSEGPQQDPAQIEVNARIKRNEKIDRVLSKLNCLENAVTKLRYGLSDGCVYSYEDIGKQFGITPECVAEIERRSVEKLRSPTVTPDDE